jgi:predicted MFS family arabinose efflux permease
MADMRLPLEPPVEQRPSLEEEKRRESSATSEDAERYLVTFDDDTCKDPKTWSVKYKIWVTIQLNLLAFAASLGSSITAPAQDKIAQVMGVSRGVTVLSISLYVLGFAFGPLFWGPVSELWGRKMSMLPATFCLGVFSIGTAVSKGPASLFITRFFGGLFGSAPNSNVAAALGDIWE